MEHAEQVTGALDRTRVLRVDIREGEEVVILARLMRFELAETRNEARLMQELASRWAGEQGISRVAEVGRRRVGTTAIRLGDDLTGVHLERLLDGRIGPFGLALVPARVHIRPGRAQDEILDPVR